MTTSTTNIDQQVAQSETTARESCKGCRGTGTVGTLGVTCPYCYGSGKALYVVDSKSDAVVFVRPSGKDGNMTELFRIKPLEWDHRPNKSPAFIAIPFPEIQYQVGWNGGGPSGFLCIRTSRGFIDGLRQSCDSPEEGKQLAEQHWQEYIKQALVPVETEQ